MLIKDNGIILKTARRGESSLDVVFLGRTSGKIRLIAKGVLGRKKAQRVSMEPGGLAEIVYYHTEGRTLYYLREISVHSPAAMDRKSLPGMATVLAALELLDKICYWNSPDEPLVDVAGEFMACQPPADPLFFFLILQIKLLTALGALPNFHHCAKCGRDLTKGYYHPQDGASYCPAHKKTSAYQHVLDAHLLRLLDACERHSLPALKDMRIELPLRKDLGNLIHWTYTYHVQGYTLPQSLKLI
ncbi:MAG: DNA repair protein RecO [Candidatus Latescibacterota bacterium]